MYFRHLGMTELYFGTGKLRTDGKVGVEGRDVGRPKKSDCSVFYGKLFRGRLRPVRLPSPRPDPLRHLHSHSLCVCVIERIPKETSVPHTYQYYK